MVTGRLFVSNNPRVTNGYVQMVNYGLQKHLRTSSRLRKNPFDEWIFGIFGGFVRFVGYFFGISQSYKLEL